MVLRNSGEALQTWKENNLPALITLDKSEAGMELKGVMGKQ